MSGISSWLQKQRKSDLQELADEVGLKDTDGLKKTDLEIALDEYLKTNSSQFSTNSKYAPFYKSRSASTGSPVKKEAPAATSDAEKVVKTVKRRVTKAAEEISQVVASAMTEDSEVEPATTRARSSAVARTPRHSALAFAQNVPLPPSPAVVADAIDRNTAVIRSKIHGIYQESGILETAEATRESLSTVVSVEALIIAFEAYGLRKELLADRYAFTIPVIKYITSVEYPVKIPDLFLLLTSSFWGPAALWAATSFFIPLVLAYFFNLTSKPKTSRSSSKSFSYAFDPLTFNIVKALLTYVVFVQDYTFGGLVDLTHVARINGALYGGPSSVLVGSAIGILVTFYEAIISK